MAYASRAKRGERFPASLYVTANVNSARGRAEGHQKFAIYSRVKAKVPIIGAFKVS